MSLATSSPAWNLSTDSHQIIRPLPPRSHHDTGEPRTSPYRRFYIIGTAGTCLAGLTLVVYPLAAFGYEIHRVLLTLLMVAMLAGAVVGAIAFMTVLAVRTVDRLCARRLAAMRAELGFDLAATVTGLQHDLGQRLGEVERDRAELQNLLRQQVATNRDLLVQVERLAKEHAGFARLVLEELQQIEAAVNGAVVVVSRRESGEVEKVNGSAPVGLDAEVIALARRIGGAIGGTQGID